MDLVVITHLVLHGLSISSNIMILIKFTNLLLYFFCYEKMMATPVSQLTLLKAWPIYSDILRTHGKMSL